MDVGQPANLATLLVPPSPAMISETVIGNSITENRNIPQADISECVIYALTRYGHLTGVLTTAELLARLEDRGIRNIDIAKALGVTPSRVTEIKKGDRAIKLDEAARLVEAFDLGSEPGSQKVPALPGPVARLIVLYIAAELGFSVEEHRRRIEELAEDIRAFAEFVSDPQARESLEAAELFFRAMRLRRSVPQATDLQESGPQTR